MVAKVYDGWHKGGGGHRASGTGKGQSELRSKTSGGGHKAQTHGHSTGEPKHTWTNIAQGTNQMPHGKEVGFVGKGPRGSPLSGKGNVNDRDSAGGKGLGSGHLVGSGRHPAHNAHGYHGEGRCGVLRTSGHKGAHQVGKRTSRGT